MFCSATLPVQTANCSFILYEQRLQKFKHDLKQGEKTSICLFFFFENSMPKAKPIKGNMFLIGVSGFVLFCFCSVLNLKDSNNLFV